MNKEIEDRLNAIRDGLDKFHKETIAHYRQLDRRISALEVYGSQAQVEERKLNLSIMQNAANMACSLSVYKNSETFLADDYVISLYRKMKEEITKTTSEKIEEQTEIIGMGGPKSKK